MGTHGRNSITEWECYSTGRRYRKHLCYEQTMDGHYAADDFTLPFLKEGVITNYSRPTMDNETDELDHCELLLPKDKSFLLLKGDTNTCTR
jgi:hypothetical protein